MQRRCQAAFARHEQPSESCLSTWATRRRIGQPQELGTAPQSEPTQCSRMVGNPNAAMRPCRPRSPASVAIATPDLWVMTKERLYAACTASCTPVPRVAITSAINPGAGCAVMHRLAGNRWPHPCPYIRGRHASRTFGESRRLWRIRTARFL